MDYLSLILAFMGGWILGYQFLAFKIYRSLLDLAKKEGIKLDKDDTESPNIAMLKIEQHGNVMYSYDVKSNDFVVQGKTFEEIAKNLKEYKGINAAVVACDNKIITILNGKVEKRNES